MGASGRKLSKMKPEVAMMLRQKIRELQEGEESQSDEVVTGYDRSPSFDNDFLPFKTEITKHKITSLPIDLSNGSSTIDFPVEGGPVVPLTREEKFAEKLQKSLARFFRNSPAIDDRQDSNTAYEVFEQDSSSSSRRQEMSDEDSLMFTEGVLNVNIVSLEDGP
jgi:hypothetical protein